MGYRCFEVEVADKVAHVVMSRPDEYNSMVREFWTELPAIARELDARGDVRAMVLSSTGKHFTAGMDLAVFAGDALGGGDAEIGRVRARLRQTALMLQDTFTALETTRFPVLVAVQGGCIGGGVDLVCAADMRYASADAWFVVQEINIGMTADVGTLQRLPRLIPEGVARELAYTGRRMPAARAAEVGLVNEVFADHDELVAGVLAIAAEIATKSPLAIWGTKQSLVYARDHRISDGLEYIATWQTGMFQPDDMAESFAARAEKRDPVYPDLLPSPDTF
ncbi:MAG: crotonase/enoyl-CoA hydratase family protein [Acidimicrobiales bacterium]|jgi:enoyl-CoA hydratase|nr:crotonase/enoyl-CoA hydratase family protein [Acidimicrobiales bacterium]